MSEQELSGLISTINVKLEEMNKKQKELTEYENLLHRKDIELEYREKKVREKENKRNVVKEEKEEKEENSKDTQLEWHKKRIKEIEEGLYYYYY